MAIFQKSVINKHLTNLDKEQVETAYLKFKENYSAAKIEKIKQLKEEEYQDGFLRDVFVDVFGYTLKPDDNHNLVREFKNQDDGRKADGAILNPYSKSGEKAIAVIELKSTKTKDLKSITEQAFNYKNNQLDCKYVITSNFQKLRFYIDYANEFEEFDLFNLPKERFELLYLILNTNSIFSDLPLKLKEETKFHEQEVSDKLYKDYSNFKRKLFDNLTKNHPESNKLTLFKKSQKLLDRFLFILFAEDSGLLPPNLISRIIKRYEILKGEDAYKPIYDIFKQYFGYMNIGRKGQAEADNIPAYNGGLFYPDELLDKLKIDDEILIDELLNLSEYDFNTEVDVNILGHIFEHSLSEIEEITAEIEGAAIDKTKSKRKKDGVFYTPKYITQYIVENTIGKLCDEKRKELEIEEIEFDGTYRTKDGKLSTKGKKLYQKLKDYKDWLFSLKIVDPACGSGAFLNQALNYLIQKHKNIDDIIAELTNTALRLFDTDKAILENNLYGVDINEESIEIAKLSLWLRTAQKGRKLSVLSNNIKCGNSLIDDSEIAGDKAFDWNEEFPQVFKEKEKKAWHVTWVTHDTRTSQRMIDYKVRERKANGQMHVDRQMFLEGDDAIKITEILSQIVIEDKINYLAYNVCNDHVHILLVCEEEELPNIIRKLKGKSSQKFKEYSGIAKDETFHLWAQKFNKKFITSDEQLYATINYIDKNRKKHNKLPDINKGLQPLVNKMVCTYEHAFRTEYNGGFDVVIGNPPYIVLSQKDCLNYTYTKGNNNSYVAFVEKSLGILRRNGKLGFIIPNTWFSGDNFSIIREKLLTDFNLQKIIQLPYDIFNAYIDTSIVIIDNHKSIDYTLYYKYDIRDYQNEITIYKLTSFPSNEWLKFNKIFLNNQLLKLGGKVWHSSKNIKLGEISKINRGSLPPKNNEKSQKQNEYYNIKWFDDQIFRYVIEKQTNSEVYVNYENLRENKNIEVYNSKKLLARQLMSRQFRMNITYIGESFAFKKNLYAIYDLDENYYYCYLLGILNSRLFSFVQVNFNISLQRDDFPAFSLKDFKNFPIAKISKESQQPFIEKADKMLELNKQLQEKKSKFINRVKDNLLNAGLQPGVSSVVEIKISKKLDAFYDYDFKTFVAELNKQKVKFSLVQQDEWEEYFNAYKTEINNLQDEINTTDKEIDQMVYELYELTEEEIAIVESSTKNY